MGDTKLIISTERGYPTAYNGKKHYGITFDTIAIRSAIEPELGKMKTGLTYSLPDGYVFRLTKGLDKTVAKVCKTMTEDKPDQPDFEKFFDDFVEAHSFRVPYDGSNKFYSDECIAACQKMKPDLKKAWTSHVLPVKEELKKKDEEMEGLIEIHHLQCEEVEKELSAVKEENKQLREKMEEKVKELTEVNDCYQRSMLNNRQLVGELKSELSKKGELINSDMLALLIEMQDSNYPGCNYSIPPLWKNKAKALIERAESTPLVKQSGDLWLIQRDGNSTEVFKNGERIEVPKDFDPLQLHLKTKSVEPVKSLQECQKIVAEKHNIGSSLVTGHKASYFNEATELYASQFKKSTN
jgi:hypothetical protein